MTQFSPEQFAAGQKNHIDTFFNLTNKVFEGVEKLTALNLQAAKSIFAETQETAQKTLSGKDPQDLLKLQSGLTRPRKDQEQPSRRAARRAFEE